MFSKPLAPSLVVLSALRCSYAAPSDGGVSYAISRAGLITSEVVTAVVLGSDSSGHTSYSIAFARPFTIATTATAPDTTFSAAATLVEGSTDAHVFEIATIGSEVVTVHEDCALGNGYAACTLVEKETATTISTVVTVTQNASSSSAVTASATPRNGAARRVGVVGTSVLVIVAVGVVLAGVIV
ncbi:hypothetical protein LXA43DRAFT_1103248 [Ganoderma leucocontextum]|nr:hypothetical protein LXA43DRAFT_1103248 [Ganoderma leucocontextum]